jgi:hypothetical protein
VAKPLKGNTILFWKDFWHDDILMCDAFPWLFSFALNEDASILSMMQNGLHEVFALPLSPQAFDEYMEIHMILQIVELSMDYLTI